jgi:hypothetical protein
VHSSLFRLIDNRNTSVSTHFSKRASVLKGNNDATEANRQYAAAYAAQYTQGDLHLAFQLYTAIMASHPGSPEEGFSQMQIHNIAVATIPKRTLLNAEWELLRAHFEQTEPTEPRRT